MWWRARFSAAACAVLVLAASCSQGQDDPNAGGARPSTVVAPETNNIDSVPQEEPAIARSQWRIANTSARDVTGNLRVSLAGARGGPVVFAFASGVTVTAQPNAVTPASGRSGVPGRNFAELYGADPNVDAHLYRVVDETVSSSAPQGGLCGRTRTTHLAVSEFVDQRGRWVFRLAAFKGDGSPGLNGVNPDFCAAYAYEAQ